MLSNNVKRQIINYCCQKQCVTWFNRSHAEGCRPSTSHPTLMELLLQAVFFYHQAVCFFCRPSASSPGHPLPGLRSSSFFCLAESVYLSVCLVTLPIHNTFILLMLIAILLKINLFNDILFNALIVMKYLFWKMLVEYAREVQEHFKL